MDTQTEAVLHLILLAVSVIAIVLRHRFSYEKYLRQKFGIDRDWWIPTLAIIAGLLLSLFGIQTILNTFYHKIDIIFLIFTFGILAEGLQKSGVFRYIAYKVTRLCKGDSTKLLLWMFITTSLLTFFTTNDVVILVLTPILIEISYQAKLNNIKLLLLSQFIAANTLSMGMIIGSPTNIIIAESMSIGFIKYLFLMILPALIAFGSSLLLLKICINYELFGGIDSEYHLPKQKEPTFTEEMRTWVGIFSVFLILVAIVTELHMSLLFCSIPVMLLALGYWSHNADEDSVTKPISNLPYGIFFFGMAFFIFANSFSSLPIVETNIVPLVDNILSNQLAIPLTGIFGSGILVNIFNDLPASAIIAQLLPLLEVTGIEKIVLIQSILAGLNIGAYVTPIGALAGIIWFNEMRVQDSKYDSEFDLPDRYDLVKFGIMNFVFAGLNISIYLIIEYIFFISI